MGKGVNGYSYLIIFLFSKLLQRPAHLTYAKTAITQITDELAKFLNTQMEFRLTDAKKDFSKLAFLLSDYLRLERASQTFETVLMRQSDTYYTVTT